VSHARWGATGLGAAPPAACRHRPTTQKETGRTGGRRGRWRADEARGRTASIEASSTRTCPVWACGDIGIWRPAAEWVLGLGAPLCLALALRQAKSLRPDGPVRPQPNGMPHIRAPKPRTQKASIRLTGDRMSLWIKSN
jgi:hypothetical protein